MLEEAKVSLPTCCSEFLLYRHHMDCNTSVRKSYWRKKVISEVLITMAVLHMGTPRNQFQKFWLPCFCYIWGLPEDNGFVTYGDSQKTMALLHMGTPRKQSQKFWLRCLCYIWGVPENNGSLLHMGTPRKQCQKVLLTMALLHLGREFPISSSTFLYSGKVFFYISVVWLTHRTCLKKPM